MTKGLRKGSLLALIISLYWKKRFSREHTKTPNAKVFPRPDGTFWAVGYHSPPPEFQLAFHIYYVKYENTLTCKRISWNSGGGGWCFKNIFLFPIYIIQKVTILAPKLSRTFMEIGNQKQNHKKETNRKLIYEDGSIWSTLIFIKIIGSETLWFPFPPSEVLVILYEIRAPV